MTHRIATVIAVGALALIGAAGVRADSLPDPRQGVGTSGPGSPPCSQFSYASDPTGAIPLGTQCTEGAKATTISVFAPGNNPLSIYSPLLEEPTIDSGNKSLDAFANNLLAQTNLIWTSSCGGTTIGGAAAQECTLTAPTLPASNTKQGIFDLSVLSTLQGLGLVNDGDCDRDDTILFVPKGCDLVFTTAALGDLPGDTGDQLFAANEQLQSTTNGAAPIPFKVPEPLSACLILAGLGALGIMRRKA